MTFFDPYLTFSDNRASQQYKRKKESRKVGQNEHSCLFLISQKLICFPKIRLSSYVFLIHFSKMFYPMTPN